MPNDFQTIITTSLQRSGFSNKQIALGLGLTESMLSRKLSGERAWKIFELNKLLDMLGLILYPIDKIELFEGIEVLLKNVKKGKWKEAL